jgi:hypothetical protein
MARDEELANPALGVIQSRTANSRVPTPIAKGKGWAYDLNPP